MQVRSPSASALGRHWAGTPASWLTLTHSNPLGQSASSSQTRLQTFSALRPLFSKLRRMQRASVSTQSWVLSQAWHRPAAASPPPSPEGATQVPETQISPWKQSMSQRHSDGGGTLGAGSGQVTSQLVSYQHSSQHSQASQYVSQT